jgi:hypothetical protein
MKIKCFRVDRVKGLGLRNNENLEKHLKSRVERDFERESFLTFVFLLGLWSKGQGISGKP